jgi:L-threonylcarbamoyladenylate synthase
MTILSATNDNIAKAAKYIRSGDIVAFPTETVYGLGADVFNPLAVKKIFEVKKRPFFDPLIVHIADFDQIRELTGQVNKQLEKIINTFWPGPLTLVLPKKKIVPEIVSSGLETIAVRMPQNKIALQLIKKAKTPLAAPSANLFSRLSPTKAEHVWHQLGERVPIILNGGPCQVGLESTIIKIENKKINLLRLGGVTIEQLEKKLGEKIFEVNSVLKDKLASFPQPEASGQLAYHYAPETPLEVIKNFDQIDFCNPNLAFLFLKPKKEIPLKDLKERIEILSSSGNLKEAAFNFYHALHKLDLLKKEKIYVEEFPDKGLGQVLRDRLKRALRS